MEVLEYVDKNLETFIEDLKEICAIPSISAENMGIEESVTKITEIMELSGIRSQILRIDGANPLIYGEYKPESYEKTIIFYNHYDVQPADPWNNGKAHHLNQLLEMDKYLLEELQITRATLLQGSKL